MNKISAACGLAVAVRPCGRVAVRLCGCAAVCVCVCMCGYGLVNRAIVPG